MGATLAITAGTVLALVLGTFALSIPLKDVSIVDIAWGLAFVDVAWVALAVTDGNGARRALSTALVSIWGLRLALYIGYRKAQHPGEDPRYTVMRNKWGDAFVRMSLYRVFLLQAGLAWIVSLPLQATARCFDAIGPLAYVGAAVWLVGFTFEAGGDLQLARFKADPANQGKVMDRGFWRYTRHPNYFGDFAVWWGLFLIALDAGGWWTIISPLIMTVLLTRVSGKDLLEKSMSTRPGYAEYVERTSGFLPRPPKR